MEHVSVKSLDEIERGWDLCESDREADFFAMNHFEGLLQIALNLQNDNEDLKLKLGWVRNDLKKEAKDIKEYLRTF